MVYATEATAKFIGSKDGVNYYKDENGQWYTMTKTNKRALNVTPDTVAKKTTYSRDKDGNWIKTVHTYRKVTENIDNGIFDDDYFESANEGIIEKIKETHEINEYNKINIPRLRNKSKLIIHKAAFTYMDSFQRNKLWTQLINYLYKNHLLIFIKKSQYLKYIDLRNYDFYGIRAPANTARDKNVAAVVKFLKNCRPNKYETAEAFMTDLKKVKLIPQEI